MCAAWATANNFTVLGLQYNGQCFGGLHSNYSSQGPSINCPTYPACDAAGACGGANANQVFMYTLGMNNINPPCYVQNTSRTITSSATFPCNALARYVTVQQTYNAHDVSPPNGGVMNLCAIFVNGTPYSAPPPPVATLNLAYNAPWSTSGVNRGNPNNSPDALVRFQYIGEITSYAEQCSFTFNGNLQTFASSTLPLIGGLKWCCVPYSFLESKHRCRHCHRLCHLRPRCLRFHLCQSRQRPHCLRALETSRCRQRLGRVRALVAHQLLSVHPSLSPTEPRGLPAAVLP